MTGIYLELFNGSKNCYARPDCGISGPILGPFRLVETVYNSGLTVVPIHRPRYGVLAVVIDMVYYDGYYYGGWRTISEERAHEHQDRIREFDEEKARHVRRPRSHARDL